MGMFDDVICERPLPGPVKPPDKFFQTKDFDCYMDRYTITSEGTLIKDDAPIPFHGILNFYTFTQDSWWFEYNAKFTDGSLVEIITVSIYRQIPKGPGNPVEYEYAYPPPDSAGEKQS